MFIFNLVEEAESQSHSAYVWGKRYVQSGAVYDVFFLFMCEWYRSDPRSISLAEFRSSSYSENCNLKSALTTGGPSSSCEVIILRNNCHGEIIRVYIRNHFSNPFRGFPRTQGKGSLQRSKRSDNKRCTVEVRWSIFIENLTYFLFLRAVVNIPI